MTTSKLNQTGVESFPFAGYYYAQVKIKDNSEITLTSLFSNELDVILKKHFPNIPITYNKTFYPFINQ